MTRYAYRAAVAVLLMATALILSVIPALDHAGQANAAGKPGSPGNPIIHVQPLVISQVCDQANDSSNPGHCYQSTFNNPFSLQPPNGQPNQQFNYFLPGPGNTACGDDISDVNCPFPGVTPGQQIVVLCGQSPTNAGHCVAFTSLRTAPHWAQCNGGTGTIAVLDGHSTEFAAVSRDAGGKTYMCENPANTPTMRTVWVKGDCQWSNLAQ